MSPFAKIIMLGKIVDQTMAGMIGPYTDPANNPLCHHTGGATHPGMCP